MNRRQILATIATLSSAGCTNIPLQTGNQERAPSPTPHDEGTSETAPDQTSSFSRTIDQPPVKTVSGVKLRVTDVILTDTLVTQEASRVSVLTAGTGSAYLCLKIRAHSTESATTLPATDSFEIAGNSSTIVPPVATHLYQPVNGRIYAGKFAGQVAATESASGWLAFEISTQQSPLTITGPALDTANDSSLEWEFTPDDVPTVTFSHRVECPRSVSPNQPITLSVGVTNTGTRRGRFFRQLTVDCEQWVGTQQRTLAASLAPGDHDELKLTGSLTENSDEPLVVEGSDQQFVSVPIE